MAESRQLLAEYAQTGSEPAFRELVDRYVDLVYSAAVRLVDGDTHRAEDVAQIVFVDLARTARTLSPNVMLGGWLHRHTCFVAAKLMRSERRRELRERRSVEMNTAQDHSQANLEQIAPVLDEAINELGTNDRSAILLRFFEQHNFDAVGAMLGSSEEAARKRVARALEKLESLLKHRGVTLSAATLGITLASGAVTPAPAGLAASISVGALSSAAAGGTFAWSFLKILTMSKLKTALVSALVIVGVTTPLMVQQRVQSQLRDKDEALRRQLDEITQLTAENKRLSQLVSGGRTSPSPRLPAPRLAAAPPTAEVQADETKPPSVIARMLKGGEPPKLTTEQIDSYLKDNRRTAASLLSAHRATGDPKLLEEAMEKYPSDPEVAFAAVFKKDATPEERRRWVEKLKTSAPNNSLANYISAVDYFKGGQTDQAVQEFIAASGKPDFQDYSAGFVQNDEELWRSSGYSVAESKTLASMLLVLPGLAPFKELSQNMVSLANSYRQAGDDTSAQAALQMALRLGERLDGSPGHAMITQLVGLAVQRIALNAMDPKVASATGLNVQDRIDDVDRQRATIREITRGYESVQDKITDSDWISYKDRWRSFGEVAAVQWLMAKYRAE